MAEAAANVRRCMDGIADLPEDALVEVLLRVGSIKDLLMFAVTSRQWLRRFTNPAFLRKLCPGGQGEGHRARLLGFFFRTTKFILCERMIRMRRAQSASTSAPTFMPTPGSPLGLVDRALTSFVADDDGTFNYAEPLATRRGIVLMHLVPRTIDFEPRTPTTHHLGLCNPITGERHVPPPLECCGVSGCRVTRYAIITASDSDDGGEQQPSSSSGRFMFSQLLVTIQHEECGVYLRSYSAATGSWSPPTMCLDGNRFGLVGEASAVVHQGAAHWLCIDRLASSAPRHDYQLYDLSVEVGTTRFSMTKLPVRGGGSPILCVSSDGKLSVACVYIVHVAVWTQQDRDEGDDTPAAWHRAVIRIPMAAPWSPSRPNEEWFDFGRGSMLVLHRDDDVFILNLQTKVMEKVMDCFPRLLHSSSDRYLRYVPYELDLVEFFTLCLAGLSI